MPHFFLFPPQRPDLPAYLLPRIGMRFRTFDEGKDFYNRYASHAGFGVKTGQTSGYNKYVQCTREGEHTSQVADEDRKRFTTTKRCKCRAAIRLKQKPDKTWVLKDIEFEHTHRMILTPSMLVFLHSHKNLDPAMLEYVKFLQFTNTKHTNIMAILAGSVGGTQFMGCHGRDLINE